MGDSGTLLVKSIDAVPTTGLCIPLSPRNRTSIVGKNMGSVESSVSKLLFQENLIHWRWLFRARCHFHLFTEVKLKIRK